MRLTQVQQSSRLLGLNYMRRVFQMIFFLKTISTFLPQMWSNLSKSRECLRQWIFAKNFLKYYCAHELFDGRAVGVQCELHTGTWNFLLPLYELRFLSICVVLYFLHTGVCATNAPSWRINFGHGGGFDGLYGLGPTVIRYLSFRRSKLKLTLGVLLTGEKL